jgi:N-methylhydantoinase A
VLRVAFDIGGTFTDVIILASDRTVRTAKLLSLLDQVGADMSAQIRGFSSDQVAYMVHATTIATNAILEGKTPTTGLITTAGFRDDLEMRGQKRPNIYDNDWSRLPPLVPRHLRLELDESVRASGVVEKPLDRDAIRQAVETLIGRGVQAVAVCFVNGYLNPVHEQLARGVIDDLAPGLATSYSHEIDPQVGEYERASTTTINASLLPVVHGYLDRLERQTDDLKSRIFVMQSNGGVTDELIVRRRPVVMIESGPAAGVVAAAHLARLLNLDEVIAFDMGGTTAKACLIKSGEPLERSRGEIGGDVSVMTRLFGTGGHALRVPSIDVVEVGTGGGSIAWVDPSGHLKVGPHSAGADPGPVCYARGGSEPTVTDANVVLGCINPHSIAQSTVKLDREAAVRAIESKLAKPLNLDTLAAAYGVVQVANASMMRALRAVTTERGRDPRRMSIIAYGGAGPIHAASLATTLGIKRVLVPVIPGLFSALGLLLADFRRDSVRTQYAEVDALSPRQLITAWREMESEASSELASKGVSPRDIRNEWLVEMKYPHEVELMTIPVPRDISEEDLNGHIQQSFADAHFQSYEYRATEHAQVVNLKVRTTAPTSDISFESLEIARDDAASSQGISRTVHFGPQHGSATVPVVGRAEVDRLVPGPLLVEEADSTIVVPPGWSVSKARFGTLVLEREA